MRKKINNIVKKCLSACLIFIMLVSVIGEPGIIAHAVEHDFETVAFSLNSTTVSESSITLYLCDAMHYIAIDDLCELTRSSQRTDGNIISVTQGFWRVDFDVENQVFDDGYQIENIHILKLSENEYAVPALMFLSYFKAIAFIDDNTLYCRMPEFTAWEAMNVDYTNTLVDIYELYGGEKNVKLSLTLDIIMDFIMGDMSTSDDYLSDAFLESLKVELRDYSALQKFKESSQNDLFSDIHSDQGKAFVKAIDRTLSVSAEPTQWFIQYYYNTIEKSFASLAYDAFEAGKNENIKHYGQDFYEAFIEKNDTSESAKKYFDNADYVMLFVSAAVDTAQQMKYTKATDNLIYEVMGRENLDYLGITAEDNDWFSVANRYKNVLGIAATQLEAETMELFTDKLCWDTLIGTGVSNAAGISGGSWMFSLNIARLFAENFPLTSSTIDAFEADRKALYLSELQQNLYWVAQNTLQDMQGKLDNPEIYQKYIQAVQLYCRTTIAMYENLIRMVDEFGNDRNYWVSLFQNRIDEMAITLYQLTTFQDDGINNCLPLDLTSFKLSSNDTPVFESIPSSFVFSSGAGGWATVLDISADGTFSGEYHDSDMGDTGAGYPNGTVYICNFGGKFAEPQKINKFTYSTKVEWLNVKETSGTVYYENDIRYIASEPYGMEDADEFFIYLPGATIAELPEEFLNWAHLNKDIRDTLPSGYYGIYNVAAEKGFTATDDDCVWHGNYMYHYQGKKAALWPRYYDVSQLLFWPESGAATIVLEFAWRNDDQTEFDAYDSHGSGEYHISIDISDDLSSVNVSVSSTNGVDLSPWGGTPDGRLSAEFVDE